MKLKPPHTQIKGKIEHLQRYIGRVHEVKSGTLCMTIWRWRGARKGLGEEQFSNLCMTMEGVSVSGKFFAGTPVHMWTWLEAISSDKYRQRIYIKALD